MLSVVLATLGLGLPVGTAVALSQAERTIFYSGKGTAGAGDARSVGAYVMIHSRGPGHIFDRAEIWRGTSECNSNRSVPRNTDRKFNRLVGYSLGRLGPAYHLQQLEQRKKTGSIRSVVLLDPGVGDELDCDRKSGAGNTYATWLRQNAANRLLIITAATSAKDGYGGIRKVYASKLTTKTVGPDVGSRVLICDAPKVAHRDAVEKFKGLISGATRASCPGGTTLNKYSPQSATTPPPPPPGQVTLAQGPSAPYGYRYAVSVSGFAASSSVTVVCRDSVNPEGFYTFELSTDASGNGSTAEQCYSADGPDHWVTAEDVESNHVSW